MFNLHLTEKTTRAILADPETPGEPAFADIRAALARLDQREREWATAAKAEAEEVERTYFR